MLKDVIKWFLEPSSHWLSIGKATTDAHELKNEGALPPSPSAPPTLEELWEQSPPLPSLACSCSLLCWPVWPPVPRTNNFLIVPWDSIFYYRLMKSDIVAINPTTQSLRQKDHDLKCWPTSASDPPSPISPVLDLRAHTAPIGFYVGAGELNTGPHACFSLCLGFS